MVVMAIMTKFITGLQEASMDGIIGAIGDGSNFIQTEGTFSELNTGMMIVATISCCAIYIVGTIFFFQSPSIASGIAGGASSGGHAFLQTGMNLAANRLMFRRLTGASAVAVPMQLAAPSPAPRERADDTARPTASKDIRRREQQGIEPMKRLIFVALSALCSPDAPGLTSSHRPSATASIAARPISMARSCRACPSLFRHHRAAGNRWSRRLPTIHLWPPTTAPSAKKAR
jgi:hypothetical protein